MCMRRERRNTASTAAAGTTISRLLPGALPHFAGGFGRGFLERPPTPSPTLPRTGGRGQNEHQKPGPQRRTWLLGFSTPVAYAPGSPTSNTVRVATRPGTNVAVRTACARL